MQDHVEFKDTVVATKRNKVIMFLAISILVTGPKPGEPMLLLRPLRNLVI
jgi:hypothetical protein